MWPEVKPYIIAIILTKAIGYTCRGYWWKKFVVIRNKKAYLKVTRRSQCLVNCAVSRELLKTVFKIQK